MKSLRIAGHLSLPLEAVTQAIGILAKRRAGKSYTMRKLAEQLLKAGQQVVIVDPKGDQWGIRSASDGVSPGLPVVILGGERADVPLEVHSGEVVAKLVVEDRVSVLLDLSLFRKSEVATFMAIFLENLYRLKSREVYRTPMMLIIDEADAIAPQKPFKGEERMLGAAEDIVRRGGQRGIGCTLVTQRSAVLNKNVLTQVQLLVVLRTIAPQDLAAIDAWIDVHGTDEERKLLKASLPSLPIGDAWFWSPGWPTSDGIFERVHVLPIETFDSAATPKPGEKRVEPKNLADVDLNVLKKQMAATIEKAKAEDPRELNKTIGDLRKEITALKKNVQPREQDTKRIQELTEQLAAEKLRVKPAGKAEVKEKKIVIAGDITRLEKLYDKLELVVVPTLESARAYAGDLRKIVSDAKELNAQQLQVAAPSQALKVFEPGFSKPSAPVIRPREATGARSIPSGNGSGDLSPLHRQILNGIALLHNIGEPEPTIAQVGAVIGKSHNAGRIRGGFNQVHEMGYAEISGNKIRLTPTGSKEAVALDIRSHADIHNLWYQRLNGNELEFLRVLINEFPTSVSLPDLGAAIGKDINAGRIRGALNALFEKGLAILDGDAVTASNLLFPAGLA